MNKEQTCCVTGHRDIPSNRAGEIQAKLRQEVLNTPDSMFCRLIKECDMANIHTEQYSKSCYMVRNRYMVNCSTLVIAVHDGRKTGGTAATIRYARKCECVVREINL